MRAWHTNSSLLHECNLYLKPSSLRMAADHRILLFNHQPTLFTHFQGVWKHTLLSEAGSYRTVWVSTMSWIIAEVRIRLTAWAARSLFREGLEPVSMLDQHWFALLLQHSEKMFCSMVEAWSTSTARGQKFKFGRMRGLGGSDLHMDIFNRANYIMTLFTCC